MQFALRAIALLDINYSGNPAPGQRIGASLKQPSSMRKKLRKTYAHGRGTAGANYGGEMRRSSADY